MNLMKLGMLVTLLAVTLVATGCPKEDDDVIFISSRAYQGHEVDADMNALVNAYLAIVGTRLDDCQTCHTGGDVTYGTKVKTLSPCEYCHLLEWPDAGITSGAPSTFYDTLNGFGQDYMNNGRDKNAIVSIREMDSDGDGYGNQTEILDNRYPGNAGSFPGQPVATTITLTWTQITSMTSRDQFLLHNTTKQKYDDYINYRGVKIKDLLTYAGVDTTGATGITIIAVDGYMTDFSMDEVNLQFPNGLFYANLDEGGIVLGTNGFVNYPDASQIPGGLVDGGTIPDEQWLMLVYWRDGMNLDVGYIDPTDGRLAGEGPYRNVIPQTTPGIPDRGKNETPIGDGYDYDTNKDHNAGRCARTVVAIRVNPMPSGVEEYDWKMGGFSLLADKEIIIYGHGVN